MSDEDTLICGMDDDFLPIEHGLGGWSLFSSGAQFITGPILGIVLNVHAADSEDNMLHKMLYGDKASSGKASHIEASVLAVTDGAELLFELPNCVVLQGKCSAMGPSEGEEADYTEDVPNGCTVEELEELDTLSRQIERLSGDWVLVEFLGGRVDLPIITKWYPNPKNKRDPATDEDGKRYLFRRNGTTVSINKDGIYSIAQRDGHYFQLSRELVTLKHKKGQLINLDNNGNVTLVEASGNSILLNSHGCTITNGKGAFSLYENDIRLQNTAGKTTVSSNIINLFASEILATGGTSGKRLCHEDLSSDFLLVATYVSIVVTVIKTVLNLAVPGVGDKFETSLNSSLIAQGITGGISDILLKKVTDYITTVLKGE